jgi:PTH1 family peptidyl-tRNA hydrolase
MAWLQKRPQVSSPALFYTSGLNKTILLVGLGKEYDLTRHNVGYLCIDEFVTQNSEMQPWVLKKDLKALASIGQLGETRVIAIKPTTFMNLSGETVQAVSSFYKLNIENTVVIHDELDIAFGQIRLRLGGSSAGHNGVKSISQQMGEDYGRIRIGIGPKKPTRIDSADFVLKKFTSDELTQLENLKKEINAILTEYIFGGNNLPTETRSFLI